MRALLVAQVVLSMRCWGVKAPGKVFRVERRRLGLFPPRKKIEPVLSPVEGMGALTLPKSRAVNVTPSLNSHGSVIVLCRAASVKRLF